MLTAGSFGVYAGLLGGGLLQWLQAEAFAASGVATEARLVEDRADEWRGGHPARAFLSAPGGRVQDAFYASPGLAGFLGGLVGRPCRPTGCRGSYNYYARPGDYLELHRDVDECDLAVISCLHRSPSRAVAGGGLVLYPEGVGLPLSAIRHRTAGGVAVDLREGETIVLLGGMVPHRLLPLGEGEARIVSILCFSL